MHHEPAMPVPRGGSMCANCRHYDGSVGQFGQCLEPNFKKFYLTTLIPCRPDAYCSDWYEPGVPVGC